MVVAFKCAQDFNYPVGDEATIGGFISLHFPLNVVFTLICGIHYGSMNVVAVLTQIEGVLMPEKELKWMMCCS